MLNSAATYDGIYDGVSNTASGGNRSCVPAVPVPRPLTITNGAVSWPSGLAGDTIFQGAVTASGSLTASNGRGVNIMGKIDSTGKITAGTMGSNCTIDSVWQKRR
jgi:hypothetical protein